MPRYDYTCSAGCDNIRRDVWVSNFRAAQGQDVEIGPCERCGAKMTRMPSAPNFKVNGFNAKNGYSK